MHISSEDISQQGIFWESINKMCQKAALTLTVTAARLKTTDLHLTNNTISNKLSLASQQWILRFRKLDLLSFEARGNWTEQDVIPTGGTDYFFVDKDCYVTHKSVTCPN